MNYEIDNVDERSEPDFGDGQSSIPNTSPQIGARMRNTIGHSPPTRGRQQN